jgi:hypothetical protein
LLGTYDLSESPGARNIKAGNGRSGDQAGHHQVDKRWGMHIGKGTNRIRWPAAERMTMKPKKEEMKTVQVPPTKGIRWVCR